MVYISLPNSKHFEWAKKSLSFKYNTIVDKPIASSEKQLEELIELSRKNKKLLVESTFFNYHIQMKKIIRIYRNDIHKKIYAKFIIPKPDKKSILMSKRFHGGVLMDMGPYISSIPRLFNLKTRFFIGFKKYLFNTNEKIKITIAINIAVRITKVFLSLIAVLTSLAF